MNREALRQLAEFDTPTVGNGLELLGVRDPSAGYTGPDVRALMPELGARCGVAVTARLDTTSPGTDAVSMDLFWEMVREIESLSGAPDGTGLPVFAVIESV